MALIGNIRKNFWIVLILLGLALAAFVLMEAVSASNRGGAGALQSVGNVAGKDIDIREFQKVESSFGRQYTNQYQAKEAAWNYFVNKNITDKTAEDLGVSVGNDELMDLQFGPNYSPVIRNNFANPQTGQVNNQLLLQYRQQIESGEELPQEFVNFWLQQKDQIVSTAKSGKINSLVSKSLFTPSYMVEQQAAQNNATVDIEYVKLPFTSVSDAEAEVTNQDISNYLNENAATYKTDEETRVLDYVVLDVKASPADIEAIKEKLIGIKPEFESTKEDSIFAINNDGYVTPNFIATDKLPADLKEASLKVGEVYGPFMTNNSYQLAKVVDRAVVADSVSASHILIKPEGITIDEAKAKVDSLVTVINGGKSFASVAEEFGQDGTKTKGGDLGTFTPERMVPEFSKVCFAANTKIGKLYTVKTQFGWHIIKVTDRIFNNREPKVKIAYVVSNIIPSQETQDVAFDEMNKIASESRNLEALKTAVGNNPKLTLQSSSRLNENAFNIGTLGGGETQREMVKWAYDASIGEVSPKVYTFTDKVNYYNNKYALIGLKEIVSAGLPSAESMKDQLTPVVRNQKKGQILASKITGTDLSTIASSNNATVETVTGVTGSTMAPQGIGYEPKVVAVATSLSAGEISKPIVGNNGVFVVKATNKTDAPAVSNIAQERKKINNTTRSSVTRSLFNALKDVFKPEDNRATYF